MKHIIQTIAVAFALFAIASCTEELIGPEANSVGKVAEYEVTLEASLGNGQQTKTVYDSAEDKIYWKAGEKLSLFYTPDENGGSKFTSTNTEESRVANFTGMISVITAGNDVAEDETYFVGVYPYREDTAYDKNGVVMTTLPVEQTAVAGSFADNLYITAGRSRGLSMGFKSVCSALVFTVANTGISKVVFEGNHFEYLGGQFSFKFDENNIPVVHGHVTDDSYAITLLAPDGGTFEPGVDYYIVTLPAEFSEGMKMTFYKEDGSYGVRKWDQKISFARNTFTELNSAADKDAVFSQAVDLGLSVKWAPFNLGAETVTDGGDYYAWGATERMNSFSGIYNAPSMESLDLEHDAANANWGGTWMMPTYGNWVDLILKCSWEYKADYQGSGMSGYLVTSNVEGYKGNSIFLPCADGLGLDAVGGFYWVPQTWVPQILYGTTPLYFWMTETDYVMNNNLSPAIGMSIRPVQPIEAEQVLVAGTNESTAEVSVRRSKELTLQAEIVPSRTFDKTLRWYVADDSVLSLESNEGMTATFKGRSTGRTTVFAMASNGWYAMWFVDVLPEVAMMPDFIDGQGNVWGETFTSFKSHYFGNWPSTGEMKNDIHYIEFVPGTDINDAQFNVTDGIDYVCINEGYSNINLDDVAPVYVVFDFTSSNHILKFVSTADSFTPQNCQDMFNGFTNLTTITGLEYLNTSNTKSMANMFRDCSSLTSLDLSHFNTYRVMDFSYMFYGCRELTSLDLGSFERDCDAKMEKMFSGLENLHYLTLGENMDFSGNVNLDFFTNVGYGAGSDPGVIWTTFYCTEYQWNCIKKIINAEHLNAGRYVWYQQKPTSIVISAEYKKIGQGWKMPLNAKVYPEYVTNKNFTWSSSNSGVVTVDQNGVVTGVAPGAATVIATAEVGGAKGYYEITVTNTTMGIASVTGYNDEIPGSGNNYFHTPALHALAGRETCPWVQLWEGGPKFASFNLGAQVDSYANLESFNVQQGSSHGATMSIQSTPNIGGLYRYGYSVLDYRLFGGGGNVAFADMPVDPYSPESVDCNMSQRLWGDNWREPTYDELYHMLINCRWTLCDGVNVQFCEGCKLPGYKVSGEEGTEYEDNVIFLPSTGYYFSNDCILYGNYMYLSQGFYWTSSPAEGSIYRASILQFDAGNLKYKNMSTNPCADAIGVRSVLVE